MRILRYRFCVLATIASLISLSFEVRAQSAATGNAEVLTLDQAIALAF